MVKSYKEIGEYRDTHNIAKHWEETKPAEFKKNFAKRGITREIEARTAAEMDKKLKKYL